MPDNLVLPNLIGVGAPRCGTRSLYNVLRATPGIYMARDKETNYFTKHYGDWSAETYSGLFRPGASAPWRGEITPTYLHSTVAPSRIKRLCPDAHIVIQVREPIERAVSHYYLIGGEDELGNINDYFEQGYAALRDSAESFYPWKHPARLLRTGFYKAAIQTYLRVFVPERVHIVSLEAIGTSPENALAPLSNALGIRLAIPRKDNSRLRSADIDRALRNELATLFHDDWEWVRGTLRARYGILP